MKRLTLALCTILLLGVAASYVDAASPASNARKAVRLAKQAVGQSEEALDQGQKRDVELARALNDFERADQVTNGRIAVLRRELEEKRELRKRTTTTSVPPNTTAVVTRECAPGEVLRSGGYHVDYGGSPPRPTAMDDRAEGNGWLVSLDNHGGTASAQLDVFAYCVPR